MSVGRPVEFDQEDVTNLAMQVFWNKGYEATSMQDLLAAMQLSKSSFYQTFSNKRSLYMRCIEAYCEMKVAMLCSKQKVSFSSLEFINEVLQSVLNKNDFNERNGCLLVNTANEFGNSDAEISKLVKSSFNKFEKIFLKALKKAQIDKEISKDKNLKSLSRYLVCVLSGLQTLAHAGMSQKYIQEQISVTMYSLR